MFKKVSDILRRYNIEPMKKLGQNFLINEGVIDKIIIAADLHDNDVVLEIGPGPGILTKKLVKRVKKVLSVEVDKKLYTIVRKEVNQHRNIQIINKNILDISNQNLCDMLYDMKNAKGDYKVVANIPYSITSPILQKFTEQEPRPYLMVLLIQKEVAQRITAKAGQLSILGVAVQFFCHTEIIDTVPSSDFYPEPEVDSAIVRLKKHTKYTETINNNNINIKDFFRIVKIGFSSKRKKLYNNFSAGLQITAQKAKSMLNSAKINEEARAQDLTIEQWIALAHIYLITQ